MNKVLAEIRIENIYNSFIHISKSSQTHEYDYIKQQEYHKQEFNQLLKQGFIWYPDFIAFDTIGDLERYWVKIAVSETLEIDSVVAENKNSRGANRASAIVLPFLIEEQDRVYVFGDYEDDIILSFTLSAGHYQLLFQNRNFTREEIEAEPNFDCQDLDYDDWDDDLELCLLTFIPTKEAIEPEIIAYKGSPKSKEPPSPLVLFNRKMYRSGEE